MAEQGKPYSRGTKVGMAVALAVLTLILWGLFELQRMPYNPPIDMRTALGGSEIGAVRAFMGMLAIPWLVLAVAFVRAMRSGK